MNHTHVTQASCQQAGSPLLTHAPTGWGLYDARTHDAPAYKMGVLLCNTQDQTDQAHATMQAFFSF
jgi:hypothetical protein